MEKAMRNQYATHIDYGFLLGVIPENPNFCPSNIDGIAERNGRFLVMEWKRPNENMSIGQKKLLVTLAKTNLFTVLVIEGHTDDRIPIIKKCWQLLSYHEAIEIGNTLESFIEFYTNWYNG